MTGIFYKFAKRTNSTARPSGGESLAIELKHECSLLNPVLLLKQANFPNYNMVYLSDFDRYYWITNIVWKNGIWEIDCSVDVLATWKNTIGNTQAYILRSSAEFDGNVFDNLYPSRTEYSLNISIGEPFWTNTALNTGYYIIGIVGKWNSTDPQIGAISYIVLTATGFTEFADRLFSDNMNWYKQQGEQLGISDSLSKLIFDPFQYIRSVRWVPKEPKLGNGYQNLRLGWWNITEQGYVMLANDPVQDFSYRFDIPKHPKTNTRGNYLNSNKFTEYNMLIPTIGLVNIPSEDLLGMTKLDIRLEVDPVCGESRAIISAFNDNDPTGDAKQIKRVSGTYGVSIELAQAQASFSQVMNAITSTQSLLGGNPTSTLSNTIVSYTDLLSPPIDYIGNQSGLLQTQAPLAPSLHSIFYDVVDDYNVDNGRPLCKVRTPSSLGGYMVIYNSDIEINGTNEESDMIKSYLEGGFFYE